MAASRMQRLLFGGRALAPNVLVVSLVVLAILGMARAQYVFIEKVYATPHLEAHIPVLPPREYPGSVIARITSIYEVETDDFEKMEVDILKRLAAALSVGLPKGKTLPRQYVVFEDFKWLTAGDRCAPETLLCKGEGNVGNGLLAPGIGGAIPGTYSGSLDAASPKHCKAADGTIPPENPTSQIEMENLPTEFDPQWDYEDPRQLDWLVNKIHFCVHKANTSLSQYPIVLPNVYVTGYRDEENVEIWRSQGIDFRLHVVGIIPVTWVHFLNRKFILNGTIPVPMYQPEVVDENAVFSEDLNVSYSIHGIRRYAQNPELGPDTIERRMPVCVDPKIQGKGCVRITSNFFPYPPLDEYKLRNVVDWNKVIFTKMASDQPYPFGAFNVSQGPWPLLEWMGPKPEDVAGPWSVRKFPQKSSSWEKECHVGNTCGKIPIAPPLRHLHSAVLYRTWTFRDQAWRYLCNELPECGQDCLTNLTCLGGENYFQDNFFFRSATFKDDDGGIVSYSNLEEQDCPRNCCNDRRLCLRTHDVVGYQVPFEREMMLVFGGKSYKHEKDPATGKLIFHGCEQIPKSDLRKEWQSCMEEIIGDMWRYDVVQGKWEYIKPDSAKSVTTGEPMGYPLARYGHSAVVVKHQESSQDPYMLKYFMYIYGGLSHQCGNGGLCNDVWKYEIPWAAQAYYPKFPDGDWNRGNEWTKLKDCPYGGRYRHATVVTSGMEYIYTYGGQVLGGFKHTLMRYKISTDRWEDLDPFGRISLTRLMYDFQGNQAIIEVPHEEYNHNIDKDCASAWRFDAEWAHCRLCADCGLRTGIREEGATLPEERGDTVLVAFADHTPGAVDDSVVIFGGYRTTWGTLRDPEAECALIQTTTTTTIDEAAEMGDDVVLTEAPLTTEAPTTTTIPKDSGIELVGFFPRIGPTLGPSTTTTTFGWTTTATTTQRVLIETFTSTTTTSSATMTTSTSSTSTSSTSGKNQGPTTLPPAVKVTMPPVVAGSVRKNFSIDAAQIAEASAEEDEDMVTRVGPEVCSQKYYFDDLWLYEATTNQFFEQAVSSQPPMARRGHQMIARRFRSNDSQLILFGGHNQDKPMNDMWILNVMREKKERTWARIDPYFEGLRPPTMAYHSMLYSEQLQQLIVFGGLHWKETDLDRSDALRNVDRRCLKKAQGLVDDQEGKPEEEFLRMIGRACEETEFCCHFVEMGFPQIYFEGTRIRTEETGALNLTAISMLCRADCERKAFFPEFYPIMVEGVWSFRTDVCTRNCSGNGYCDLSQCVCMPEWYGIDCSLPRCPGSPCYTDPLTREQFCIECSNNGRCIDGECQCFAGWGFADCSAAACENNCSSTPTELRGVCVEDFPVHQCACQGRYSGLQCETLLCLNGCSGHGDCQPDGTCMCHTGYHGVDCSLWTLSIPD